MNFCTKSCNICQICAKLSSWALGVPDSISSENLIACTSEWKRRSYVVTAKYSVEDLSLLVMKYLTITPFLHQQSIKFDD